MDANRAQSLLDAERARVKALLDEVRTAGREDRESENEQTDAGDEAEGLTAEGTDDAVEEGLAGRLAALDRAQRRLDEGTYGRSVRSGRPIPDDRLEADPAAELTVDEAREAGPAGA